MTISIENESGIDIPDTDISRTAKRVVEAALDMEGCPYEAEVNILITDNARIREINAMGRGIDRATDVLSFPMNEFDVPAGFSGLEEEGADCFDPDTGELLLGDIAVSAEKVIEQAERYGHGYEREYAFLIAHSMFHLMGYDHETPGEAAVMEEKQEAVLALLGIGR